MMKMMMMTVMILSPRSVCFSVASVVLYFLLFVLLVVVAAWTYIRTYIRSSCRFATTQQPFDRTNDRDYDT